MLPVSKPLLAVHPLQKLVRVLCPKSAASKGKPGPALWLNVAQPATAGPDSLVRCVILQAQVSVVPFFRSRRASPGWVRYLAGTGAGMGTGTGTGTGTSMERVPLQCSAAQCSAVDSTSMDSMRPSAALAFRAPIHQNGYCAWTGLNTSPLPCRQPFSVKLPD